MDGDGVAVDDDSATYRLILVTIAPLLDTLVADGPTVSSSGLFAAFHAVSQRLASRVHPFASRSIAIGFTTPAKPAMSRVLVSPPFAASARTISATNP